MNPASPSPAPNVFFERTPDPANSHDTDPPTDVAAWEQRMAKLVGLSAEEELPLSLVNTSPDEEETDFADLNPLSPDSPQSSRTAEPLSANPLAKLGLVGSATLAIVLLAGIFLSQIMGGGHHTASKSVPAATPTATPKNETQLLSGEVETLKTKLALAEQAEAVRRAQETLRREPLSPSTVVRMPVPSQTMGVRTVYVPRIITVEKIVKVPQTVSAAPKLAPNPPSSTTSRSSSSQRIVKTSPQRSPSPLVQTPIPPQSTPATSLPTPQVTPLQPLPSPPETKNPTSVAAGVTAKAVLATAVFGETMQSANNQNDNEKNVFVVRLQEPLKSVDGAIALPENTELLTEIKSLSEQGLIQLRVIKGVIQENGKLTEIDLPPNAMIVRAPEGQPLIANQYPNQESSITGMDMGLFLLGGLGKVAELINRTESQVITTSASGSIISNANPKSNVLAGVLEGGANTVVPQIAQRNQQSISQMMQRTNIWFIAAGTEVEVYVNQLLQL
jgi:hypothetical protein